LWPNLGVKGETEIGGVYSLEYTHDGKVLVASGGGAVVLFNPLTGKGVPLDAPGFQFCAAAVAPDAKMLAYSVSRKINDQTTESQIVLESIDKGVSTGKRRRFLGDGWEFGGAAFSPDGKTLAVGGGQGVVEVWDLTGMNPERRARLEGHSANPVRVCFSPDGTQLVSAGWDGRVILWDVSGLPNRLGGAVLATRLPVSDTFGLDFVVASPVGPTVVAGGKTSDQVRFISLERLPEQPASPATFRVSHGVNCMAMSPNGRVVSINDGGGNLRMIDVEPCQQQKPWPNSAAKLYGSCMVFSPRGDRLLVAERSRLLLFNVVTGDSRVLEVPISNFEPTALAFDREGAKVAAGDGGMVYVWNDIDAAPVRYPAGNVLPPIKIKIINFQPGGGLLGIGTPGNGTPIWDLIKDARSDEPVQVAGTHSPSDVTISEDGTMLAGSGVYDIQLWDLARKQPWGSPLKGHGAGIKMLTLLPGGKRLVSAGQTPWLRRQIAENMEGGAILEDQCLFLWDVEPESWLGLAHQLVNRQLSDEERRGFNIHADD
jgi:WD40 repeat protein